MTISLPAQEFIAFDGIRRIASGSLRDVVRSAKAATEGGLESSLYVVDVIESRPIELDLRGTLDDALSRLPDTGVSAASQPAAAEFAPGDQPARGPGRPRLGVVAREVTLLPRHWAWLADQPGGASAALRRLVDRARVDNEGRDALRHAQESAYRFMSTLLGDQPDFDEAARALFAGHGDGFRALVQGWPADARDHLLHLAERVFALSPRAR